MNIQRGENTLLLRKPQLPYTLDIDIVYKFCVHIFLNILITITITALIKQFYIKLKKHR